jgi:molybdate transport system substrate-binding protein
VPQAPAEILRGHTETIGARLARDLAAMADLPAAPFDACDQTTGRVSSREGRPARPWPGEQAELGVVPVTSILAAAPEVMLVGRSPAELQSYLDFAIDISADCRDPEAAGRLSEYLTSTAVDVALAEKGVER